LIESVHGCLKVKFCHTEREAWWTLGWLRANAGSG
jgi:hypothetical protein